MQCVLTEFSVSVAWQGRAWEGDGEARGKDRDFLESQEREMRWHPEMTGTKKWMTCGFETWKSGEAPKKDHI